MVLTHGNRPWRSSTNEDVRRVYLGDHVQLMRDRLDGRVTRPGDDWGNHGARTKLGAEAEASSLVMTPQLQQAISLLQLSNIELCSASSRPRSSATRCWSTPMRRDRRRDAGARRRAANGLRAKDEARRRGVERLRRAGRASEGDDGAMGRPRTPMPPRRDRRRAARRVPRCRQLLTGALKDSAGPRCGQGSAMRFGGDEESTSRPIVAAERTLSGSSHRAAVRRLRRSGASG